MGEKMTKQKEIKKINKEMTFAELMEIAPEMRTKLMMMGLGCSSCPMAQMESIEGGAIVHGIDPEALVEEINKQINKNDK